MRRFPEWVTAAKAFALNTLEQDSSEELAWYWGRANFNVPDRAMVNKIAMAGDLAKPFLAILKRFEPSYQNLSPGVAKGYKFLKDYEVARREHVTRLAKEQEARVQQAQANTSAPVSPDKKRPADSVCDYLYLLIGSCTHCHDFSVHSPIPCLDRKDLRTLAEEAKKAKLEVNVVNYATLAGATQLINEVDTLLAKELGTPSLQVLGEYKTLLESTVVQHLLLLDMQRQLCAKLVEHCTSVTNAFVSASEPSPTPT
ncbi:hypothetical protein H0H93_015952, partial [Arthromyces matolae]